MARTIQEIETYALGLPKGGELTIDIEEATLLIKNHQASRVSHGKVAPEFRYSMKKMTSGKAQIHGHKVVVKE